MSAMVCFTGEKPRTSVEVASHVQRLAKRAEGSPQSAQRFALPAAGR